MQVLVCMNFFVLLELIPILYKLALNEYQFLCVLCVLCGSFFYYLTLRDRLTGFIHTSNLLKACEESSVKHK